jgi:hypothetical protein
MLANFLTCFGTLIALGLFLETISTREFCERVGRYVFSKHWVDAAHRISLGQMSADFINNTIFRFFKRSAFSFNSLFKSAILSAVMFIIICLIIQLLGKYDFTSLPKRILLNQVIRNNGVFFLLSIFFYIMTDYLSFIQTYYFMKYASAFKSVFHIIFIAYADLILSLNIFVFIFPISLMFFLLNI